ncbi:MAG TPA: hypothetical protein VKO43_01745 [Candidatus Krumholzibacteriaceae bacterium]|nr:hypothetical protein [Candidatus Krumholzibacteriaceae bacterium]
MQFHTDIRINRFSVRVESDDERIIKSLSKWIDYGILKVHRDKVIDKRIFPKIRFHSGSIPEELAEPDSAHLTASFEDIDFYSYEDYTLLVIGGSSIIKVEKESPSATGYVSRLHLESPWILCHRIVYLPVLEILRNEGVYYIHAGCVTKGGKSVLLCGGSGGGKSTLTYALSLSGFSYMSDDAVFIENNGGSIELFSFPERLKLSARSCSFFPGFEKYTDIAGKAEIPVEETEIESIAVRGNPHALVFPEISNAPESRLLDFSKDEAFLRLIRQSISLTCNDGIEEHLDLLKGLTEKSLCRRLEFGRDFSRLPGLFSDGLFERS